jgi:hypothetical protein
MDAFGVLTFPMPPGRRHPPSRPLELKLLQDVSITLSETVRDASVVRSLLKNS